MRKITANLIYPVSSAPLKDAYLLIDGNGKIVDLVKYNRNNKEPAFLEYYSGILIPGFVNPHCRLDLSQLKAKIDMGQGQNLYINQVESKKAITIVDKQMQKALRIMWLRGINGLGNVADINLGKQLWLIADSGASSPQLSILEHMKTVSLEFPEITFDTLLEMATLNGANALGMDDSLGSFDIGKQPGVLLVSGFDFKKQQLRKDAEITRLV